MRFTRRWERVVKSVRLHCDGEETQPCKVSILVHHVLPSVGLTKELILPAVPDLKSKETQEAKKMKTVGRSAQSIAIFLAILLSYFPSTRIIAAPQKGQKIDDRKPSNDSNDLSGTVEVESIPGLSGGNVLGFTDFSITNGRPTRNFNITDGQSTVNYAECKFPYVPRNSTVSPLRVNTPRACVPSTYQYSLADWVSPTHFTFVFQHS